MRRPIRSLWVLVALVAALTACTSGQQSIETSSPRSAASISPTATAGATPETTPSIPAPTAPTPEAGPTAPTPQESAPADGERVDELLGVELPPVEGYRYVQLPQSVSETLLQSLGAREQAIEELSYVGVTSTDGQPAGFLLASTLRGAQPGTPVFRRAQREALTNASPEARISERTIAGDRVLVGSIPGGALYSWSVDDVVMVAGGPDAEAAEAVATAILSGN